MEQNFPVIPIFRNFRPTSRGTPKFRKMSVPFTPLPGISGIFGRMESAQGFRYIIVSCSKGTKSEKRRELGSQLSWIMRHKIAGVMVSV